MDFLVPHRTSSINRSAVVLSLLLAVSITTWNISSADEVAEFITVTGDEFNQLRNAIVASGQQRHEEFINFQCDATMVMKSISMEVNQRVDVAITADDTGRIRYERTITPLDKNGAPSGEPDPIVEVYDGEKNYTMSVGSYGARSVSVHSENLTASMIEPRSFSEAYGKPVHSWIMESEKSDQPFTLERAQWQGAETIRLSITDLKLPSHSYVIYMDPAKAYYPIRSEWRVHGNLNQVYTSVPKQLEDGNWFPETGRRESYRMPEGEPVFDGTVDLEVHRVAFNLPEIPEDTFRVGARRVE